MKALTTKKERSVVMGQLRPVSKVEKLIFPILVTIVISPHGSFSSSTGWYAHVW